MSADDGVQLDSGMRGFYIQSHINISTFEDVRSYVKKQTKFSALEGVLILKRNRQLEKT